MVREEVAQARQLEASSEAFSGKLHVKAQLEKMLGNLFQGPHLEVGNPAGCIWRMSQESSPALEIRLCYSLTTSPPWISRLSGEQEEEGQNPGRLQCRIGLTGEEDLFSAPGTSNTWPQPNAWWKS
ncbi:uncharacterized protein LOC143844656 [Paroedura picta]|uniref:uncharacterized protein LOC143844656 n=1 Tax=Paroedura picta TaxID=143630 RepID=UPI004056E807